MTESDDLIREFLIESHEGLDRLDQDLVALERDPLNAHHLASIFRTMHTLKGSCGFLGYRRLEALSHVGENLLSKVRDEGMGLDAAITTGLLSLVDAVRDVLRHIETDGTEGRGDYTPLVAHLTVLQARPAHRAVCDHADRRRGEDRRVSGDRRGGVSDTSLRVDVNLMDRLMDLVGELRLARDQVLQGLAGDDRGSLALAAHRLDLVTADLQEGVMRMRMQPLDTVWGKYPRLVRDLAAACGKQVRIEMEGRDTALDRSIVEAIKDPLTHIIRNAIDHGIEEPAARGAAGKPVEGLIRLRAGHERGQVTIEIADDGAGIDVARVREKAVARRLVAREQAHHLADAEILALTFLPGFSTAAAVTHLSGRGVGMDIVKTNVERIGGSVAIDSVAGRGTVLRLRIPVTASPVPVPSGRAHSSGRLEAAGDSCSLLVVETAAGLRVALPLALVSRFDEVLLAQCVRTDGRLVMHHRGDVLPLVPLDEFFRLRRAPRDAATVVVCRHHGRPVGLLVERILDIVSAPVSREGRVGRRGIAGVATIRQQPTDILDLDAVLADGGRTAGHVA